MGPYRLPPEKSLAEQWEDIKKAPRRYWIAALVLFGLLTFSLTDLAIRIWRNS